MKSNTILLLIIYLVKLILSRRKKNDFTSSNECIAEVCDNFSWFKQPGISELCYKKCKEYYLWPHQYSANFCYKNSFKDPIYETALKGSRRKVNTYRYRCGLDKNWRDNYKWDDQFDPQFGKIKFMNSTDCIQGICNNYPWFTQKTVNSKCIEQCNLNFHWPQKWESCEKACLNDPIWEKPISKGALTDTLWFNTCKIRCSFDKDWRIKYPCRDPRVPDNIPADLEAKKLKCLTESCLKFQWFQLPTIYPKCKERCTLDPRWMAEKQDMDGYTNACQQECVLRPIYELSNYKVSDSLSNYEDSCDMRCFFDQNWRNEFPDESICTITYYLKFNPNSHLKPYHRFPGPPPEQPNNVDWDDFKNSYYYCKWQCEVIYYKKINSATNPKTRNDLVNTERFCINDCASKPKITINVSSPELLAKREGCISKCNFYKYHQNDTLYNNCVIDCRQRFRLE